MTDMSLSSITKGRIQRPVRVSLYGVDGVGKTSFAAGAPNPIFIATEDGTHHVDVHRFNTPESWEDLVGPEGAISNLYLKKDHGYKTVVVDSLDWAEALCNDYVVAQYNAEQNKPVETVTDIPYGGWKMRKLTAFSTMIRALNTLWRDHDMNVILVSHANIVRFDDPERDTYERYELKLFRDLAAKVREWSDYNLFANYDMSIKQVGQGFNQRQVGQSHGKRLLFSQRRAAYDAKARYPIPERLDLSWESFWDAHAQAAGISQ